MLKAFSENLSLLRKEKNLSQRGVARDLGVSQALLSHYENGLREPGLSFVVLAAGYYGVSADYLIGRTTDRDGRIIGAFDLHDDSEVKDNRLRGSVALMLQKKLLVNSVALIYDLFGKTVPREYSDEASAYLSAAVYKVFRQLYTLYGKNPDGFFGMTSSVSCARAEVNMKLAELKLAELTETLSRENPEFELSYDAIKEVSPQNSQSLFALLQSVKERLEHT